MDFKKFAMNVAAVVVGIAVAERILPMIGGEASK